MASYPGAIKNFSTIVNGVTKLVAALFNSPNDEITAVETELGTDVAGSVSDLKTRLAVSLADSGAFKTIKKGSYAASGAATVVVPHTCGVAPTAILIIVNADDGSGNSVGMWINGMTNITSFQNPAVNKAISVDATNFTITSSNGTFNVTGTTYYFLAITAA